MKNTCWICEELIDDENVRDHCHVTEKYRGVAHWSCNVNLNFHNHNHKCSFNQKRSWKM